MRKCCTNCFESDYIKNIILRNKTQGNCDYCKSENVNIYDTTELSIFFKGILDLYEITNLQGHPLDHQIATDFKEKVFSQQLIASNNIKSLIIDIIKDDIDDYKQILDNPVRLKYHNSDAEEAIIKPLSLSWDSFSTEIKTVNRFHFGTKLDLEKLKYLFGYFEKTIAKGKKFYRARICDTKIGYHATKMGNPPNVLAKSGRANPNGISYLYLANDVTTTLYEVRATLYDYVSVGTFRLEEDLKIINLSSATYDVFKELESLEDLLLHSSFIDKLESELSKPRRRNDSELDYLPTQYLSELIKSMGFHGIEFRSSLYSQGYNLAVFYPEKFKCIDVKVYDIEDIKIEHKVIDESIETKT